MLRVTFAISALPGFSFPALSTYARTEPTHTKKIFSYDVSIHITIYPKPLSTKPIQFSKMV